MDEKVLKRFGAILQRLRLQANFTQEELAERAGCHRNYIGLVERGERNPSLTRLLAIAIALGIDPSELLHGLTQGSTALPK